ncbi:hypothetical protein BOTCAL_0244g00100 [Botryotinia calthae]|uniref:Uncharacterized protein n=1 Tax=Botryotinia calthae TaxID=38488 RepID=A0A4Y8CZN5_9HELO|nr:hypothetical protein BOTCAL_0244g00100 [Botryotinia calthae]
MPKQIHVTSFGYEPNPPNHEDGTAFHDVIFGGYMQELGWDRTIDWTFKRNLYGAQLSTSDFYQVPIVTKVQGRTLDTTHPVILWLVTKTNFKAYLLKSFRFSIG